MPLVASSRLRVRVRFLTWQASYNELSFQLAREEFARDTFFFHFRQVNIFFLMILISIKRLLFLFFLYDLHNCAWFPIEVRLVADILHILVMRDYFISVTANVLAGHYRRPEVGLDIGGCSSVSFLELIRREECLQLVTRALLSKLYLFLGMLLEETLDS